MAKTLFAVFDRDREYVGLFLSYLKSTRHPGFAVIGFTEEQALLDYVQTGIIDLLLYSGPNDKTDTFYLELLEKKNIRKIAILYDRDGELGTNVYINKFRPASEIVARAVSICPAAGGPPKEMQPSDKSRIVAVVAAAQGASASEFSLAAVEIFARKDKVLYVNLHRFFRMEGLGRGDISDVIFCYRTNRGRLKAVLDNARARRGRVDMLTAPDRLDDLDEVGTGKWLDFLESLADAGGYGTVVLDMAEGVRDPSEIFAGCRLILNVKAGRERFSENEVFREYICESCGERCLQKVVDVDIAGAEEADGADGDELKAESMEQAAERIIYGINRRA